MSTKQTLVLLVAAIALLALVFLSQQSEKAKVEEARSPSERLMAGMTSNTLERIEVVPPEGTSVTLTKRDGAWYVNPVRQWKADKNHMTQVFNTIEKEIVGEVVSTNKSNHGEYQVNESSATRIRFYGSDDKLLEDLLVGKQGASFTSTFVRKAGKDHVLNANAQLSYTFNKPEGWRDKGIFDIQSAAITGLDCEGTSGTWTVAKSGADWKLTKPSEADVQSDKLLPVINSLATLRAVDFADTTETLAQLGLDPPRQKIAVRYEDRASSPPKPMSDVLLIGNKNFEKENYYVKRADSDIVYMIAAYTANTLTPNSADLQVAKAAPVETKPKDESPTPSVQDKATTAAQTAPGDGIAAAPVAAETKTTGAAEAKPVEVKVPEVKPEETKTPEAKPQESKAAETSPPVEEKAAPSETKPADTTAPKAEPAKIKIEDSTTSQAAAVVEPAPAANTPAPKAEDSKIKIEDTATTPAN